MFSIQEQLLDNIGKQFRGGLVSKAHILLYHSTLGVRVMEMRRPGRGLRRRRGGQNELSKPRQKAPRAAGSRVHTTTAAPAIGKSMSVSGQDKIGYRSADRISVGECDID